jgi:hypothetical protein
MADNHRTWVVPYFPGDKLDKTDEPPTFSQRLVDFIDHEIDSRLYPGPEWPGPRCPHISSDASRPWRKNWPESKRGDHE